MRSIKYFIKRYIHLMVFISFMIISLLLIANAQNTIIKQVKAAGLTFFSGFQFSFSGVTNVFTGISGYFTDVNELKEELRTTRQELIKAHQVINEIKDLKKQNITGNIFKNSLQEISERQRSCLSKHITGWDFCKDCDEYYTFNF